MKVDLVAYTHDEQRSMAKMELARCLNKGDDLMNAVERVITDGYPTELVEAAASELEEEGAFDEEDR